MTSEPHSHGRGRLAGQVALIVGGGSIGPGLSNGRAAALLFAREGARVAVVDCNPDSAAETADLIRKEGNEAIPITGDVTIPQDSDRIVTETVRAFGKLDVLHNNVGILRRGGIADQTLEDWDAVIRTNLTGTFLTCQAAVRVMAKGSGGSIVNVSSVAGVRYLGVPYMSYAAAKAAILQLTAAAAVEQAPRGIRVNAVLPGLIDTPMVAASLSGAYGDNDIESLRRAREEQVPLNRLGDPWDVAHAALFLASDEAKYITGTHVIVDGGLTAKC